MICFDFPRLTWNVATEVEYLCCTALIAAYFLTLANWEWTQGWQADLVQYFIAEEHAISTRLECFGFAIDAMIKYGTLLINAWSVVLELQFG